jgi:hypothetical protein
VRFFEEGPAGLIYSGEDRLKDSAVGTPSELMLGVANDLDIAIDNAAEAKDSEVVTGAQAASPFGRNLVLPLHLRVRSAKNAPVTFEVRQAPFEGFRDFRVKGASLPTQRKAGDWMWRFTVPAHGEATLSYDVRVRNPDLD